MPSPSFSGVDPFYCSSFPLLFFTVFYYSKILLLFFTVSIPILPSFPAASILYSGFFAVSCRFSGGQFILSWTRTGYKWYKPNLMQMSGNSRIWA